MRKPGPGGLYYLHTINKVTAERQLTLQWHDEEEVPLFHAEMTQQESVAFVKKFLESMEMIWPGIRLAEGL